MHKLVIDQAYRDAADQAKEVLGPLLEQYSPAFLRLALHDALTWEASTRTGGANGSIHTHEELKHEGNPGLAEVVEVLESVHSACAPITRADLYQLAGMMAVEQLGGPHIEFRPGRPDSEQPSPPGRLPVFETCLVGESPLLGRMARAGLSQRHAVALCGAHPFGRWWSAPAKYEELQPRLEGSSPRANRPPPAFDASVFSDILEDQDPLSRHLAQDPQVRILLRGYAADPDLWMDDYAEAFQRLSEAPTGLRPPSRRASRRSLPGSGGSWDLNTVAASAATAILLAAAAAMAGARVMGGGSRRRDVGRKIPSWKS